MEIFNLYTDGACSGNPGPGGWGFILINNNLYFEDSGKINNTTNNRMELTAVIEGLKKIPEPAQINLYSDSQYVINGLQKGWAKNWKKNNWIKSNKKPALNSDLWEELLNLIQPHEINYFWVKGHAQNKFNNRCDELAVAAIKS